MKRIKCIYLLMAALITLSSCKDSDADTTLYNDAAITGFYLGTMKRNVDGVTKTFAGSNYPFRISQVAELTPTGKWVRTIENADSLPKGTDVKRVVCNITTRNNGLVVIQDVGSDTLRYYNASDSIDFSQTRRFVVMPSDGSTSNTQYDIKVNVHREKGDSLQWHLVDEPMPTAETLPAGIKVMLGKNYSGTEMYALSDDDKLMVSKDNGSTWTQDCPDYDATDPDNNSDMLPLTNLALVSYPMDYSIYTDYVLLVGTSPKNANRSVVWRKIVDYEEGAPEGKWTYIERDDAEPYNLPIMTSLNIIRYDESVLAFGGDYSTIYQSRDNGITWKTTSLYKMPADFDKTATGIKVTTDSENNIRIFCYGTNKVWKGRVNRLGWDSNWLWYE
ncbi:MAG: hypothetical protein ILA25_07515 [Prevotella sp.]|nr:hypothetical protein [Prevotella sp.]